MLNMAAKPHLFLASPAERPIHLRRMRKDILRLIAGLELTR
jgi:hypothetical protein